MAPTAMDVSGDISPALEKEDEDMGDIDTPPPADAATHVSVRAAPHDSNAMPAAVATNATAARNYSCNDPRDKHRRPDTSNAVPPVALKHDMNGASRSHTRTRAHTPDAHAHTRAHTRTQTHAPSPDTPHIGTRAGGRRRLSPTPWRAG